MALQGHSSKMVNMKGKGKPEAFKIPKAKRAADNSHSGESRKRPILGDLTNFNKGMVANVNNNGSIKTRSKKAKITATEVYCREEIMETDEGCQYPDADIPTINEESEDIIEEEDTDDSEAEDNVLNVTGRPKVPNGVDDFDRVPELDHLSEPMNAPHIFKYYQDREENFKIEKYMASQPELNEHMRRVLIDWMVEVQESFELNHETLYLSVKLLDMYLAKNIVKKAKLQLVGATAILISSKYDERVPPLIDDFIFVCDDSYTRQQILTMERELLMTVGFDLGIPLSYRFLRRYARCSNTSMEILTLARYILETSLMEYELIDKLESKLAAASLLLAFRMRKVGIWTRTLEYYTCYAEEDLLDLVQSLNKCISPPFNENVATIKNKYSHEIFFEVAKVPPLPINVD